MPSNCSSCSCSTTLNASRASHSGWPNYPAWPCPLHKIKLDAPQVTLFAPMREARRVRTELRKTSPGHPLLRLLDTIGGHKARRNIRIGIPTRKGVKRAGTLQSKYSVVVHNLACNEFTVANGDESI